MAGADARRTKSTIVMVDGSVLKGEVICGASGRLESVLFDPTAFLEFYPYEGLPKFIAKRQIVSVEAEKFVRDLAA